MPSKTHARAGLFLRDMAFTFKGPSIQLGSGSGKTEATAVVGTQYKFTAVRGTKPVVRERDSLPQEISLLARDSKF